MSKTLKSKLQELVSARNQIAEKQWTEVARDNFHRSLDHRSFYFRKHDKKFTNDKRFEKEPEFRINNLLGRIDRKEENKEGFETDTSKYPRILNTFEGLTNIEKCNHGAAESELQTFECADPSDRQYLPVFVFVLENREICEDTFSFLMY